MLKIKQRFGSRPKAQDCFLVERGFLTSRQLAEAEDVQRSARKPYDEVLIRLGMAGEREILQAKAQEMGMPFADVDRVTVDQGALEAIPADVAREHRVVPLKKQDATLWIAISKTGDIQAIDAVTGASGCRVIPVMGVPAAIDAAIERFYGAGPVDT